MPVIFDQMRTIKVSSGSKNLSFFEGKERRHCNRLLGSHHFEISIMEPSNDVKEDEISNPLMHLLSLDLKPSIKKSKAEDSLEESMKIKRVRFSEDVNQFSYVPDEKDSNILLNHVDTGDDNNNSVMTIDLASLSEQNESGTFLEETEFENCISSSTYNVESTPVSGKSNGSYFNFSYAEAFTLPEDLLSGSSEHVYALLEASVEPECKKVSVEMKMEACDLNDVINQMEGLIVEKSQSEKNDSALSVNTIKQQSDILPVLLGNSVCEGQMDNTALSVSSIKKRSSSDDEKQSCKLNSALIKKSAFSSASELSSAVFKAWCEVKDNAKDIKTTSLNEIKVMHLFDCLQNHLEF
ncbi:uncharacterized protein TNIN_264211 [Trichonephila inaurata madagascariensis]|uniref:Uncharacterized protein n=1 Tax=Trichonephila inaurata madagascariensis TaxID=2747483 RepID=A0A8X6XN67_9ARAC|nr:uncharacterized protein TNIN_264211 [Trichonephila inaurata madagascariensis]